MIDPEYSKELLCWEMRRRRRREKVSKVSRVEELERRRLA